MKTPVLESNRRILVVEDEADAARLVAYHLQRRGLIPVLAADGQSALDAVAHQPPDLIILDVMLPQCSGLDVCRQLRADPVTKEIPILMLTALAGRADKLRGFGCGADDYLAKPYDMDELIVRVYALLRRSPVVLETTCQPVP